mgnify:CR=1 FL=1
MPSTSPCLASAWVSAPTIAAAGRAASAMALARPIERLGSMNNPKAASLIALAAHDIPQVFPREALAQAAASVGFRNLHLDPINREITLTVEGMKLDFGGIAKGYAVDRALAALRARYKVEINKAALEDTRER